MRHWDVRVSAGRSNCSSPLDCTVGTVASLEILMDRVACLGVHQTLGPTTCLNDWLQGRVLVVKLAGTDEEPVLISVVDVTVGQETEVWSRLNVANDSHAYRTNTQTRKYRQWGREIRTWSVIRPSFFPLSLGLLQTKFLASWIPGLSYSMFSL
jgi:hypothetical protein